MVDHRHYVPVLLTKRGERRALRELDDSVKNAMTPLFVIEPIDMDFDTGTPKRSPDEHLQGKAGQIAECWGARDAFVDLLFIDDTPLASGNHPLVQLTGEAAQQGFNLIPVVSVDRTPAFRQAVAEVVQRDSRGACLRLPSPEWPSAVGMTNIDQLLRELSLSPEDVDLVLDVSTEVAAAPGLSLNAALSALAVLPNLSEWRSLVLLGASFPKDGSELSKGLNEVERIEWAVYQQVNSLSTARKFSFGDYAIAYPDPTLDVNPIFMSISAQLRYTATAHWLIAKGELFKGSGGRSLGGSAVPPAAELLRSHPEFRPSTHCTMEQWVNDVADSGTGGGNPEAWRRYGTHHHVTVVTEQLATLHGP